MPKFNKKYEREEEKGRREKMLNFGNVNTEIYLPNSCYSGMKCAWSAQSEKKKKFVTIVVMPLPKMGGKKKKNCGYRNLREELKKKVLRPQYFYNKS